MQTTELIYTLEDKRKAWVRLQASPSEKSG
jgi:hypothetical protein